MPIRHLKVNVVGGDGFSPVWVLVDDRGFLTGSGKKKQSSRMHILVERTASYPHEQNQSDAWHDG